LRAEGEAISSLSTSPHLYPKKSVIFQGTRILYGNLTPLVPLSFKGEGEDSV